MSSNKYILPVTAAVGALVIFWTGLYFAGSNLLALLIIVVIAGVYSVGVWELHRFRLDTSSFSGALDTLTAPLDKSVFDFNQWLGNIRHACVWWVARDQRFDCRL